MKPLLEGMIRFNAGQQCDMVEGPCSCGAWHQEASDIVFWGEENK